MGELTLAPIVKARLYADYGEQRARGAAAMTFLQAAGRVAAPLVGLGALSLGTSAFGWVFGLMPVVGWGLFSYFSGRPAAPRHAAG